MRSIFGTPSSLCVAIEKETNHLRLGSGKNCFDAKVSRCGDSKTLKTENAQRSADLKHF
jgi:hypothetical protein